MGIPAHRLKSTAISNGVLGIRIYNKLPPDMKHLRLRILKKDLKNFLMGKAYCSIEEYLEDVL